MRVNRGSIGGLIGVHVSTIVKWGYQDNFKPAYCFYEKVLNAQKAANAKQKTFTILEVLVRQEIVAFVA